MNFNFVKLRRKLNYLKNLCQYIFTSFFIKFQRTHEKEIEIIHCNRIDNKENKELVFLGNIIVDDYLEKEKLLNEINRISNNPCFTFYFSQSKTIENDETNIEQNYKYNVALYRLALIDLENIKIGIARFELNKSKDLYEWKREVTIKRRLLKQSGANFLVAYICTTDEKLEDLGKLKKLIGTWGFNCVIGIDKSIKGKQNFRTILFGETRILYSLGQIVVNEKKYKNEGREFEDKCCIAYKISIKKVNKKIQLMKEGYIPLFLEREDNRKLFLKEIRKTQWGSNEEKSSYLYLEHKMQGLRNWRELILLSDIFKVINVPIPVKYKHLFGCSVNQICARTYELSPGNIFFFRRSFKDKNDLKKENEVLRNKLILRAISRKSLFIFSYKKLLPFIPHVVIEDPTESHIKVMAWYRKQFISAKYIGVTGSVGKTSTKDMLYYVLKEGVRAGRNQRNSNVQVKIGINEQKIPSDTEIYVQEIGGGRPGGASRHSRMILPDAAIVTNIGTAHIGNYESQEDLKNNKLGIIDGMDRNGMLFLNADDPLLIEAKPDCAVTYFALSNRDSDYYADKIKENVGSTYFNIVSKSKTLPAKINVLGEYNVLNAICSYAVAKYFGMDDIDILNGLENFKTTGIRQNIIDVGGFSFFVDCYNASVDSIENSLSVLTKLTPKSGGRRIAVIGDVTGMGDRETEINKKIAKIISSYGIDIIVCYGNNSEIISSLIENKNVSIMAIKERKVLEDWMRNNINRGDITLIKGSSRVKLDEILDTVFGLDLADQRYIDEAHYSILRRKGITYRVFEGYVSLIKFLGNLKTVNIDDFVLGKALKKISREAFLNNRTLEAMIIGHNVIHIGNRAFKGCESLKNIIISENVRIIGSEAFGGCVNLEKIALSKALIYIEKDAFKGCTKLKEIIVSESFKNLGIESFDGCNAKIKTK